MKFTIFIVFMLLISQILANGTFFPNYELDSNGGDILINGKLTISSDFKKTSDPNRIFPKDKLNSGKNGYALIKNNLGHFIIIAPNTEIQFLPSSYDNHTFVFLKKGKIILKNEFSHKIHLQIKDDILSFSKSKAYVTSIGNTERLLLLSGSARFLSHNKFKIILNGPQVLSINYKKNHLTHSFPPKRDSLASLNIANKSFKYSNLQLFYRFISVVNSLNPNNNAIPIKNFLPPKTAKASVKVIAPSPSILINGNTKKISANSNQFFKIDKGLHSFRWNNQTEFVLVKDFRQLVVSISDDSHLKAEEEEEAEEENKLSSVLTLGKLKIQSNVSKKQKKAKPQFKTGQYRLVKEYGNKSFPLLLPLGITVRDKQLFVADAVGNKITCFDKDEVFEPFKTRFLKPNSIRYKNGHFVVSDTAQNLVLLFDKILKEKVSISFAQNISRPKGVDYDGSFVYIADSGNNIVKKIKNGKVESLGGKLNLNQPGDVLINQAGNIIISDTGNRRVLILNKENSLIRALSIDYLPGLMAEDKEGQIYITNPLEHQVNIYDKNLFPVSFLQIKGATPYGVTIDAENLIYVSLTNIEVVKVYEKIK